MPARRAKILCQIREFAGGGARSQINILDVSRPYVVSYFIKYMNDTYVGLLYVTKIAGLRNDYVVNCSINRTPNRPKWQHKEWKYKVAARPLTMARPATGSGQGPPSREAEGPPIFSHKSGSAFGVRGSRAAGHAVIHATEPP